MLTIYPRHTKACLEDLKPKNLSPEELRSYRHCKCPKWFTGTHEGRAFPRESLNTCSWDEAERKVDARKKGAAPEVTAHTTIEHAISEWLREARNNNAAPNTLEQWESIGEKFKTFAHENRIKHIALVTPELINKWREAWKLEQTPYRAEPGIMPSTAKLRLTVAKMLFKHARRNRFVSENPMDLVYVAKAKRGEASRSRTMPLDVDGDTNYRALLNSIDARGKGREYLSAITELMYETGLRVSDALMFRHDDIEVDVEDGWATYTTIQIKTGTEVTVAIPAPLVEKLQALEPKSADYLFYNGKSRLRPYYRNHVYGPLKEAATAAKIVRMHPHRLRDSFAVNRLNEGMAMHDVSKLLGHASVEMTERYYDKFVKSRRDALVARRKVVHGAKPARKVVTMKLKKLA